MLVSALRDGEIFFLTFSKENLHENAIFQSKTFGSNTNVECMYFIYFYFHLGLMMELLYEKKNE